MAEFETNSRDCPYCGPDCAVGYGHCHCGCGSLTTIAVKDFSHRDVIQGEPMRYLRYHYAKHRKLLSLLEREPRSFDLTQCRFCLGKCPVGVGMCHCGCGKPAAIATETARANRAIAGLPSRFAKGHRPATNRQFSDAEVATLRRRYLDEDVTQKALCEEYGIAPAVLSRLLRGLTYPQAGIAAPCQNLEQIP